MMGIIEKFKKKIIVEENIDEKAYQDDHVVDNLIALGVLLWVVAEADDHFLPEEKDKIKEVLRGHGSIRDEDMPIVLRSIKEASINRIDIHSFSREVRNDLNREKRIEVIENLFRVACSDNDLDEKEHEMIRTISSLLRLDHKEFISAKVKIKKEFGMDTAGL